MKLANQTKPVMRNAIPHVQANSGIIPSDNCGCGKNCCYGPCLFGTCLLGCAPCV